jgi:hypothetical protein
MLKMKWLGLIAVVVLLIGSFLPWVYIESKGITVTGVSAPGTNFGKPGYFHLFLALFFILFHFTPRIWAKRTNLLVSGVNFAWGVRNYFVIAACSGGDCPEKKTGLYLTIIASVIMLLAALFPDTVPEKSNAANDVSASR